MATTTRFLCLLLIAVVSTAVLGQDKKAKVTSTDAQKEASGVVEQPQKASEMRTVRVRDNRIVSTNSVTSIQVLRRDQAVRGKASVVQGDAKVIRTLKPSSATRSLNRIKNKKAD